MAYLNGIAPVRRQQKSGRRSAVHRADGGKEHGLRVRNIVGNSSSEGGKARGTAAVLSIFSGRVERRFRPDRCGGVLPRGGLHGPEGFVVAALAFVVGAVEGFVFRQVADFKFVGMAGGQRRRGLQHHLREAESTHECAHGFQQNLLTEAFLQINGVPLANLRYHLRAFAKKLQHNLPVGREVVPLRIHGDAA